MNMVDDKVQGARKKNFKMNIVYQKVQGARKNKL